MGTYAEYVEAHERNWYHCSRKHGTYYRVISSKTEKLGKHHVIRETEIQRGDIVMVITELL